MEVRERISGELELWEICREVIWKPPKPGDLEIISTIDLNKE
jgi:hypothetical protein